DEERPAPVPATAEILRRAPATGRMPEEQILASTGERLARVLEPGRCGRPLLRPRQLHALAMARGEVDLDDFSPRRLQPGAQASSDLSERQRAERQRETGRATQLPP